MDRIDQWRLFTAVATELSFNKVAKAQGRSQQSVTRAIQALEGSLGTRLLHRTTRSVSLTDDGARYLERVRRVLSEIDQVDSELSPRELRGVVSVTAPVLFGRLHVAPLALDVVKKHAGIDVRLMLIDRVVSLAEEGVDIGIRIGHLPDSALRVRRVGETRLVMCASPDYLERRGVPRDIADVAHHDWIAFTSTSPLSERWSFPIGGKQRSVSVRARVVVNTGDAAIEAALAGIGLVRLLHYQVAALIARGKLRTVLPDHEPAPVPIQVVQLPGARTPAASVVADHVADRLTKRLAEPRTD